MKPLVLAAAAIALLTLAGCKPATTSDAAAGVDDSWAGWFAPHNRYTGVGVYNVGPGWSRLVVAHPPKDPAAARISDDEHVIVVVDGKTGELRQCGDLSGYCIGMKPWATALPPGQVAPAPLTAPAPPQAEAAAAASSAPAGK
jgi:hypothetical protein